MANDSGKMKKFVDWVNADAGLPALEELEHKDSGHDDHGHSDGHSEIGSKETDDAGSALVDEEFDYSGMFVLKDRSGSETTDQSPAQVLVGQNVQLTDIFRKWLRSAHVIYCISALALTLVVIIALFAALAYMPLFGNPGNPTVNEVYTRYIEKSIEETGAVNTVAGMILDYRAFDTLGESFVLFTAVVAVIILIRVIPGSGRSEKVKSEDDKMGRPLILQIIVMMAAPFIMVYGIYILFNGHLSPGGGFSGGAILGAGIALYAIAFGAEKVRTIFTFKTYTVCSTVALLFYALVKGYAFCMGASGLPTGIPLGTPGNLLSSGLILPLNICVGIVVACTVYGLYALFSEGEV